MQTFTSNAVALAISASVPTVTIGQIVAPLVILIFFIFGGLFVNLDKVPVVFRWIQWLSWISYSNKALAQNEFDGLVFKCVAGAPCFATGADVISSYSLSNPTLWYCVIINVGISVGVLAIGFFAFNRTSRPLMRLK